MSVASRLSEAGHYASQQIKQISTQLDQEWKSFAAALDERSTILAMSAVFHQKSEQVPDFLFIICSSQNMQMLLKTLVAVV